MATARQHTVPAPAEAGAGTLFTLLAALGFAAVSTLTSIATGQGVSLPVVLMWRYVIGAVVMVTFVATRNYPRMPWREAVRFIVLGGGGQALLVGMALSSLRYITVATLAFLFYTYPAWVTLVQTVRGAEKLTLRRLAALALSFGGIVVIVGTPLSAGSGARRRRNGMDRHRARARRRGGVRHVHPAHAVDAEDRTRYRSRARTRRSDRRSASWRSR